MCYIVYFKINDVVESETIITFATNPFADDKLETFLFAMLKTLKIV